ncbi:TPA: hypothetical protein DD690_01295 [Candidatus Daviesbacteria bacterium]|nr:MAG: hypothetical protein A3D02_00225 [Candidatus Daviesbacteria bacterium RIFCSPHIGHO2_02_FULL_39_41]OGE45472.1 MAG: hypothetical protein A3E67_03795 [Candidatus Daviesbacteria bacterium RIFCSPHIGHO2_12_FULL_38_25]OGE67558.1 MAG: hypothetical protein A3H81_00940 [Candidatus Daviesbacteria bacterium RIFCSPLOWO2_02_FULL_38_18]OGE72778.1 MAG: hypothetical protein A3H18_03910 [Candidatus Daviesbacteria bacterium RIFCSPLOWO2_12_FULL_38_10]HBQ50599.1 hypothetical protein [Candidatus Daviesbacteri
MGKTRIAKDELVEKLKLELGIENRPKDDQPLAETEDKPEIKKEEKIKPKKQEKKEPSQQRSKKYLASTKDLDKTKTYSLNEAIDLVKKLSYSKFIGTLEAHINTIQTNLRGLVTLPFASGKTEYKTEAKAPVIHLALGKLNQPTEELAANVKILLQTVGKTRIKKVVLSPTMGPGVKLDLTAL